MHTIFLKEIQIIKKPENEYFSHINCFKNFEQIKFNKPITFLTGENGTGKSTLLEAIAINCGFNPEGGSKNFNFTTNNTHSGLFKYLKTVRGCEREKDGFFLRAESFYNLATYAEEIGLNFDEYGDKSLHMQSHGESFINLIKNRFRGKGLYILDEPESALSLQRQMTLMIMINSLVEQESQFIIVSHSPLLLAMPNAQIISLDHDSPIEIDYEETTPYELMELFINNKDALFSQLFDKD